MPITDSCDAIADLPRWYPRQRLDRAAEAKAAADTTRAAAQQIDLAAVPAHPSLDHGRLRLLSCRLRRYLRGGMYVFFAIEVGKRNGHVLGVTVHTDGVWTTQQARNLLMQAGERPGRFRFLIRDRAGLFTEACDAAFVGAGIEVVKISLPSPRANACTERWVRSVRAEVTDRMRIRGSTSQPITASRPAVGGVIPLTKALLMAALALVGT